MDKTEYAFPRKLPDTAHPDDVLRIIEQHSGMQLRDYFAARAMVMFFDEAEFMEEIAEMSYEMADAMLEARNADKRDIELAKERLKTIDTAIKVDINDL